MKNKERSLPGIKRDCVKTILGLHNKAHVGHIGTSLSCVDILIHLFFSRMKPQDRFILSKGHAASALYTVLARSGKIPTKALRSYYAEGTSLAGHPPCNKRMNGIIFGTGSLGHGLSLASGIALSSKFTQKKFNVYCVLSDGDCNEGSTWEAALFSGHHKLKNLTVIIDRNRLQGFGKSKDVLDLEPLKEKWRAFNFDVEVARNGNDFKSLRKAFSAIDLRKSGKPKCIIANTVKGSGVSFMENKMEWHYLPMNDEQYDVAIRQTGNKHA